MILEQTRMVKTIILTTHNMHDAEELCDRVAFNVDGNVKALDTPQALRQGGANTKVVYRYKTVDGYQAETVCLLSDLGASAEFCSVLKTGSLVSIHSKEQTLEDVFISMTGRCLQ